MTTDHALLPLLEPILTPTIIYRPWGHYEVLDIGRRYKVKRLCVEVGKRLSLQKHRYRAEHWVVIKGVARITCGERDFIRRENESAYIPAATAHRLENIGPEPLHIIEVQVGDYISEDDILRLSDDFNRQHR